MADTWTSEEPQDRLTRMAAQCWPVIEASGDHNPTDRMMMLLNDGLRYGIAGVGYADGREGGKQMMADLLSHVAGIGVAFGIDLRELRDD